MHQIMWHLSKTFLSVKQIYNKLATELDVNHIQIYHYKKQVNNYLKKKAQCS